MQRDREPDGQILTGGRCCALHTCIVSCHSRSLKLFLKESGCFGARLTPIQLAKVARTSAEDVSKRLGGSGTSS